jgi:hypothetical protein
MTSFDLPSNINDNPKSLVRRVQPCVIIPQMFLSTQETNIVDPVGSTSSAAMAEMTIREFSAPLQHQCPYRTNDNGGRRKL